MADPDQKTVTPTDTKKDVPPPAPIQVGSNGEAGGYKFDPDGVDGVITKWKNLLTDLQSDEKYAMQIAGVKAPGKEFASGDFTKAANPSGDTLLQQTRRMITYVTNYITALENAKKGIQQGEDDAKQAVQKQSQGM
ncbi:hypothetical protein [Amycolatopsis minnesotensis]|uniref:Excreted virulence factor EspC, type VII ESX diderm n=1 Tax=Amycolatopsis minnesotensis TaxID=337894 RepID=A0ABP5CUT0_9PSEU